MSVTVNTRALKERSKEFDVGNMIYLSGDLVIARDQAHRRLSESRVVLGEIVTLPIYHCGPIVKSDGEKFVFLAAGPTTSARMEGFIDDIMMRYHTPAFIGKGGFGSIGKRSLKKYGAFYCEFTGGASAYAVSKIRKIHKMLYEDLGSAEALWIVEVENFGPLLVTQDSRGNDLRSKHLEKAYGKLDLILERYGL
ncbi:MAG: FumA C-terminus/TtdB family hydratase beta subunit [Nitrososphaeria archaeon]